MVGGSIGHRNFLATFVKTDDSTGAAWLLKGKDCGQRKEIGSAFGQNNTCILCFLLICKYYSFYMRSRGCVQPVSVLVVGNDEEAGGREDDKCMTRDSSEGVNLRPAVTAYYREGLDLRRIYVPG